MNGSTRYHAGLSAEHMVASHYQNAGYTIAERRYRGQGGEIDLIAKRDEGVVFIEVKKSKTHARAAERVSARQIQRIFNSASQYLGGEPNGQNTQSRFDVALVDGSGRVDVLENVYAA